MSQSQMFLNFFGVWTSQSCLYIGRLYKKEVYVSGHLQIDNRIDAKFYSVFK